jgi:KaiC/GvpD/RAD55 family RecA-like ATPase
MSSGVEAMADEEYSLPGPIPIDSVPPGTNVLLSGPPMSGKSRLLAELLVTDRQRAIVVTADDSDSVVRSKLRDVDPGFDADGTGIVDCVSHQRDPDAVSGTNTRYVASPGNLTSIGVNFTELIDEFSVTAKPTRVGLHTVSQLLMYASLQEVYQFLQVFTGQIQTAGWLGVTAVHSTVHDDRDLQTVETVCDGIVETRVTDESRQLRTRGFDRAPTPWVSF